MWNYIKCCCFVWRNAHNNSDHEFDSHHLSELLILPIRYDERRFENICILITPIEYSNIVKFVGLQLFKEKSY